MEGEPRNRKEASGYLMLVLDFIFLHSCVSFSDLCDTALLVFEDFGLISL